MYLLPGTFEKMTSLSERIAEAFEQRRQGQETKYRANRCQEGGFPIMFKSKILAITLPAIALSASLPVFADTVTRYEVTRTTDGVTNVLEPGVVEYRRFSSSTSPNLIETRTITNSVVAPTSITVPVAPAPVVLERRVQSLPVVIERTAPPVVMEQYNPPVVVERRYRTHHHHLIDAGVPLVHFRAF